MTVTLTREGGSTTIMTPVAARKLLDPEGTNLMEVFAELGVGRKMRVRLLDGTFATLKLTERSEQPELFDDGVWPLEATNDHRSPAPTRPHYAHVRAMIDLDLNVALMAIDEVHAERIIREVFRGERPAPPNFHLIFDVDTTRDFMNRLRAVFQGDDNIASVGIVEAMVTGFSEPSTRVLEYTGP